MEAGLCRSRLLPLPLVRSAHSNQQAKPAAEAAEVSLREQVARPVKYRTKRVETALGQLGERARPGMICVFWLSHQSKVAGEADEAWVN